MIFLLMVSSAIPFLSVATLYVFPLNLNTTVFLLTDLPLLLRFVFKTSFLAVFSIFVVFETFREIFS